MALIQPSSVSPKHYDKTHPEAVPNHYSRQTDGIAPESNGRGCHRGGADCKDALQEFAIYNLDSIHDTEPSLLKVDLNVLDIT
jgi:hypothetical protein